MLVPIGIRLYLKVAIACLDVFIAWGSAVSAIKNSSPPPSRGFCRQESFSFSTKDRAPYLVTLEVLDSRQQRLSPSIGANRGATSGGGGRGGRSSDGRHRGVEGGARVAAGDDAGGGGGGRLIRMLTPKALGQSLREIADNTLTTLKIGGSAKEGRRNDDGSGSSGEGEGRRTGGALISRYGQLWRKEHRYC